MTGIRRWLHAVGPVLLVAVVLAGDALLPQVGRQVALIALLDEPAHLATAALVLAALLGPPRVRAQGSWVPVALLAAVLIDLDHAPLYLGVPGIAPAGRPLTHSLATPVALSMLAAVLPRSARRWVAAIALGICLHLVRDLATGPGVSLCWPLTTEGLLLPHQWYTATVVALGVVVAARRALPQERRRDGDGSVGSGRTAGVGQRLRHEQQGRPHS